MMQLMDDMNDKISSRLTRVLERSIFQRSVRGKVSRSGQTEETGSSDTSPLSFLVAAAAEHGGNPNASASIFSGQETFREFFSPTRLGKQLEVDPDQIYLLNEAFLDARNIRKETGGQDDYLGLRHVLFAILVPETPRKFSATYEALSRSGTDPAVLSRSIAAFCQDDLEPGEDVNVWVELARDRLPKVTALQGNFKLPHEVSSFGADDPWAGLAIDRSGAAREADAFATMICWREFKPPMAVGVFGDWGSGKSFFMRLVHEAIDARCAPAPGSDLAQPSEIEPPNFLSNVVQIRFNAWHYAETNLWASLVDHMLTELDQWATVHNKTKQSDNVFRQLETVRERSLHTAKELVERRKKVRTAEAAQTEAKEAYELKRRDLESLPETWVEASWEEILGDDKIKKEASDAAALLGVTSETTASMGDLREAVSLYSHERNSATRGWLNLAALHPIWTLMLALSLLALPPFLIWLLGKLGASAEGSAVVGILSPLAIYATFGANYLRRAHSKLAGVHAKVQALVDAKTSKYSTDAENARVAVEAARAEERATSDRLHEAKAVVERLAQQYNAQDGKAQLLDFVRRRAGSGDYREQLGFIAQIRRDFDELNRLMAPKASMPESDERQKKHAEDVANFLDQASEEDLTAGERALLEATTQAPETQDLKVFERIVLYIDDLDRCPPEQVVIVLQAIHLLLAYPLFVVFVAVDVRWLQTALEKEYPQFARSKRTEPGQSDLSQASPGDYLEKIFQIPYWVRPMGAEGTRALLADHIGPSSAPVRENERDSQNDTSNSTLLPKGTPSSGSGQLEQVEGPDQEPEAQTMLLRISAEERAFIEKIAVGLDGSPRRTLRFANTYRLIKAGLEPSLRADVDDGAYCDLLLLLALQVAMPDVFLAVLGANTETDLAEAARKAADTSLKQRLDQLCEAYSEAGGDWSHVLDWAAPVSRFGFGPRS